MYSMIGYEKCIYVTPCGYCSKFDKWCEKKNKKSNITISNNLNDPINKKVNIGELIRGFNESKGDILKGVFFNGN